MTDDKIDRIIAEAPPHCNYIPGCMADDKAVTFYEAALDPDTGLAACRKKLASANARYRHFQTRADRLEKRAEVAEAVRDDMLAQRNEQAERAEAAEAESDELREALARLKERNSYLESYRGE